MKIAIGMQIQFGPWGGGNQFGTALSRYLSSRGHSVVYDLEDSSLDLILLTEPRRTSQSSAFNEIDVFQYLARKNWDALVVHRVNECDERKNTRFVDRRLALANRCADSTVFISKWLEQYFANHGFSFRDPTVIRNGADVAVFHPDRAGHVSSDGPIKLVTHHWGGNWMKGFDVYSRIDDLLSSDPWRGRVEFTYVGNLPPGFQFRNVKVVAPLVGEALAAELRNHDLYITASLSEPAGMHHIEGALCGLPLLYRRSGALPEYCSGFGVEFEGPQDVSEKLERMMGELATWQSAMRDYPHTSEKMCDQYHSLFSRLLRDRGAILSRRGWKKEAAGQMRLRSQLFEGVYQAEQRARSMIRSLRGFWG